MKYGVNDLIAVLDFLENGGDIDECLTMRQIFLLQELQEKYNGVEGGSI